MSYNFSVLSKSSLSFLPGYRSTLDGDEPATCGGPVLRVMRMAFVVSFFLSALAIAQSSPQSTILDLAAKAESFEAQGLWQDAAAEYQQILKVDPRSVPALNALGALSVKQGDFKQGISYYQRALKINSREFGTNLNLGIALIKIQDYKSAAPALESATEINPSSFQAQELLGVARIGRDEYARAIPPLEKALSLEPRDPGSNYLLIRAYIETKQFKKALDGFDRLEQLDPARRGCAFCAARRTTVWVRTRKLWKSSRRPRSSCPPTPRYGFRSDSCAGSSTGMTTPSANCARRFGSTRGLEKPGITSQTLISPSLSRNSPCPSCRV